MLLIILPALIDCRGGRGGGGGGGRSSSGGSSSRGGSRSSYSGRSSYRSYSGSYVYVVGTPGLYYYNSLYSQTVLYQDPISESASVNVGGIIFAIVFLYVWINLMVIVCVQHRTGRTCKQVICCLYCCKCEKPEKDDVAVIHCSDMSQE